MLYELKAGRSKKKMRTIMIDTQNRCEQYKKAREATPNIKEKWHAISPAPLGSKPWKQKTCTIGGNKDNSRARRIGEPLNGWVGKKGVFNPHT